MQMLESNFINNIQKRTNRSFFNSFARDQKKIKRKDQSSVHQECRQIK